MIVLGMHVLSHFKRNSNGSKVFSIVENVPSAYIILALQGDNAINGYMICHTQYSSYLMLECFCSSGSQSYDMNLFW